MKDKLFCLGISALSAALVYGIYLLIIALRDKFF